MDTPHNWSDPSYHYVVRRIREGDKDHPFVTGTEAFDRLEDPSDYGTLRGYWRNEQDPTQSFFTYVLNEVSQNKEMVIGILRYRYEGQKASTEHLVEGQGPYLYISRLGLVHDRQEGRLVWMLIEFFRHLVFMEMRRLGIDKVIFWWRANRRMWAILHRYPQFQIFDEKLNEQWGWVYYMKYEFKRGLRPTPPVL